MKTTKPEPCVSAKRKNLRDKIALVYKKAL